MLVSLQHAVNGVLAHDAHAVNALQKLSLHAQVASSTRRCQEDMHFAVMTAANLSSTCFCVACYSFFHSTILRLFLW